MARSQDGKDSGKAFDWKLFTSHLTGFGILTLCTALFFGVILGVKPLERRSAALSDHGAPKIEVIWPQITDAEGNNIGTWLPVADQEAIMRLATDAVGSSIDPFSNDPLGKLGGVLAASGWFDGTPIISRQSGSTLRIEGRWRVPVAVIRHDGRDFVIDHNARQLPPIYQPGGSTLRFIADPVMSPPTGVDGSRDFLTPWPGEDIVAGLELLSEVGDEQWSAQIAGVDVKNFSAAGTLELVTKDNTRVAWGGRVSKPQIGDVSSAQKLMNISALYKRYGRVDGNYARAHVYRSHIIFDTSASAEALAAQQP